MGVKQSILFLKFHSAKSLYFKGKRKGSDRVVRMSVQDFFNELNKVRANPTDYVANLTEMVPNFRNDNVYTDKENNVLIRTKEGKRAVEDGLFNFGFFLL